MARLLNCSFVMPLSGRKPRIADVEIAFLSMNWTVWVIKNVRKRVNGKKKKKRKEKKERVV